MQARYYEVLGIQRAATLIQIKSAYRRKALENHPDRHPDEKEKYAEIMKEINNAYAVLSDPDRRAEYDKKFPQSGYTFFNAAPSVDPTPVFKVNLPSFAILTGVQPRVPTKIVLIGSIKAEKSIFLRNLFDRFDIEIVGADFKLLTLSNGNKFQIWDTAGSERFRSMVKMYYRDASLILFFDDVQSWVTDLLKSFDPTECRGYRLDYNEQGPTLEQVESVEKIPANVMMQAKNPDVAHGLGLALLERLSSLMHNPQQTAAARRTDDAERVNLAARLEPAAASPGCCK